MKLLHAAVGPLCEIGLVNICLGDNLSHTSTRTKTDLL